MDDFTADLNKVLKYGRIRPQQDWTPHVEAMHESRIGKSGLQNKPSAITHHARLILADKLADEGDPREHLLRAVNTPESNALEDSRVDHWPDGQPHSTDARTTLADGTSLSIYLRAKTQTGTPDAVRMHWYARTPTKAFMGFGAHFTPEHAKSILQQFHPDDAPGIENLIGLIDKHFPAAKS